MKRLVLAAVFACGGKTSTPPVSSRAPDEGKLAGIVEKARTIMLSQPQVVTTTNNKKPEVKGADELVKMLADAVCPGAPPRDYRQCTPIAGAPALVEEAWRFLGDQHFMIGEPEVSIAAYEHIPRESKFFLEARYKIAWSNYKLDRFEKAIDAFDEVARTESPLRGEAIQYIAISLSEPWSATETPDGKRSLQRALARYRDRDDAVGGDVFEALGDAFGQMAETAAAASTYKFLLQRWPNRGRRAEIEQKLKALGSP